MKNERVITVCKAEPILETDSVQTARIHISKQMPHFTDDMDQYDDWYEMEAKAIERALWASLPGGTYDRLLGLMLARKATHFVVAHGELEQITDDRA